jgi:hypothetical protein
MGTNGWRDRVQDTTIERGGRARPLRARVFGARLAAAAALLSAGCLDIIGDVNVDAIGTDTRPIKTGGDVDCSDAGQAAGTCVVRCEPGAPRCTENLLQHCNEAGDGWILVDQCASAALCDAVSARCNLPPCATSEYRCTADGALQVCRADRTDFELVEQCTSAAFCSAVPGREICDVTPCRAGRQRCNGPQIEQCRDDRSGYDIVGEPCASAALCVEGQATTARCDPATCAPGTFICDGARLSRCSDDANRYIVINDCGSADLCSAVEQRCTDFACAAGAQRCTGNVLERCNVARSGYDPVQVCASAPQCDPTASTCLTVAPTDGLPDPSVLAGADYTFAQATSTAVLGLGPMTLRVPQEWSDVDRSAWTNAAGVEIGPRLIASRDAARFARNFDIPGVYFAATEAAPVEVAARQQDFDLSSRCAASTTEPYDDDLYSGTVRTWTDCGVTKATTSVVVAVDKEAARFVTVVIVTMTADRDRAARNEVWESFIAD